MIVLRSKRFAFPTPQQAQQQRQLLNMQNGQQAQQGENANGENSEPTMRDLQLEQARLQRQQTQIQHQKTQLRIKEEMNRRNTVVKLQKIKKDEEEAQVKNQVRIKKEENDNNDEARARNAALYKTRPKVVQPVGMPRGNK